MRNIKLILEYEGTRYGGWQRQKNIPTIQGTVEERLARIVQHPVTLRGAGRTDAGVHALGQVANFTTSNPLECRELKRALNTLLPPDIKVRTAEEVEASFDARRSARMRWYRYQLVNQDYAPVLDRHLCAFVPYRLDHQKLSQGVALCGGTHNFAAFRSAKCRARRTVLDLQTGITWEGKKIILDFRCRSFLHHMVRMLVGALIELGRGKLSLTQLEEMLATGTVSAVFPTAPAQGLVLMEVSYEAIA